MKNKSTLNHQAFNILYPVLNNKILIIQDERKATDSICEALEKENYEFVYACNGKQGLEIWRRENPILIILDLKMAVMNGIEFLEQVECLPSAPYSIIVLTGLGDDDDIKRCFRLGIAAFVRKPFNIYELRGLVKYSISVKHEQQKIEYLASFPQMNMNPILEVDCSGSLKYFNRAAGNIIKELDKDEDISLFFPKDMDEILKELKQGKEKQFSREIVIKDHTFGERIHIVPKFSVVRIYVRDITERKQIEVDLEKNQKHLQTLLKERIESDERFKLLVDTIPDIVYKIDKDGNFTFINKAATKLGYRPEELIGRHFSEIIHIEDVDAVSREKVLLKYIGQKAAGEDQPKLFDERRTGERITKGLEVRLLTKKDSDTKAKLDEKHKDDMIFAEINSTGTHQVDLETMDSKFIGTFGVIKDQHIGTEGTTGVIRDVSDRKKYEDELRKLTIAVEQSPSIVMITGINGMVEYVNPKFEKLTGFTSKEVNGKNPSILKSGEHSLDIYQELWSTITSGGEWRGELHNRKKNGELYWEHASISPIKTPENVITHFVKVSEDITRRKEAEDELIKHHHHLEKLVENRTEKLKIAYDKLVHSEKLNAVGKLTASIAHEFNNPIFGILNILERLNDEAVLDETNKNFVGLAIRECDRITNLIRKLQDFYRPSTGKEAQIDIHDLIEDVLLLTQKKIISRNIKLTKDYTVNIPTVTVVADQIKQVILNLLTNAEQAIPESGGTISISTKVLSKYLSINIRDSGEGISDKDIKNIFEPFFTTKAVKGTGMGLSVSYGIIKQHGGEIKVESKLGSGTTFSVMLPFNIKNNN